MLKFTTRKYWCMNMKNNSTPKNNYVVASRVLCGEATSNATSRLLRREEHPPHNDMFTVEVTL